MFKGLTRFSLKNGAVIFIAMIMVILGGIYSYGNIPNADFPDVDIPYIHVNIAYPGATPQQAYDDIGKQLEPKLATISDIQKLISYSSPNSQSFLLELDMNRPVKDADRDIQDVLNQVQLPSAADKPVIRNESASSPSIYTFTVTSGQNKLSQVQSFVENTLSPKISSVSGVSEVRVNGDSKRNIYVQVNLNKLKSYGLTWQQVQQALIANNFSAPIGNMNVGQQTMPVVVGGNLTSLGQIRDLPIVLVKQDTSGLTNAFGAVQSGMTTMGGALGQLGKNEGYIQGELQVIAALQGISGKYLSDATQLQLLTAESKLQPSPSLSAQIAALSQAMQQESAQIQQLQQRLKGLSAHVQFPSSRNQKSLQLRKPGANGGVSITANVVPLGHIADLTYQPDPSEPSITRTNGNPGVLVQVVPATNANTIQVVKDVQAAIQASNIPTSYHVDVVSNQATEVKKNVNGMIREAALGALFAVLVTLLFLRDVRATLVAIFSIPLSIFAALIVLNAVGYSLNIMTLSGIAVAVGRVVDDSIVVIENIYRRLRQRNIDNTPGLIEDSTSEVGKAITSSTITTVAVFLPMTVVPGIVGHFFAPFAWTVVIALTFSLFVALMVVPFVARYSLLRTKPLVHTENVLQRTYRSALRWSLSHKWIVIMVSIALLVESGYAATKLGFNFLPASRIDMFSINVTMPTAANITSTNQVVSAIEQRLQKTSGVKEYLSFVQPGSATEDVFVADDVKDTDAFGNLLRSVVKDVPGAHRITVSGTSGPGGNNMTLLLTGGTPEALNRASAEVVSALSKIQGLADITASNQSGQPQIQVKVNANQAGLYGLDPMTIAGSIRNMISGNSVTTVNYNGSTTNVVLMAGNGNVQSLANLGSQTLTAPTGQQVPIDQVATVQIVNGPNSIARMNQQEYVEIDGIITAKNQGQVTSQVNKTINQLALPAGVTTDQEGAAKQMHDGFVNIGLAMLVSFVLVLIAMLITFGEWAAPLAIVFALPFAIVGGFNSLWLTKQPLGMPGMIGFMMLIGIIVTNAIVLMDRVERNRHKGAAIRDALVEAGGVRLRPILMTATATVGALIPLALTNDAGLISKSLAIVVIGGLITSTLLTLFIVPIMYDWFASIAARFVNRGLDVKAIQSQDDVTDVKLEPAQ